VTVQGYSPTRQLVGGAWIAATAILVALATVLAMNYVTPIKVAFAFGGLVLLLPAFVLRDPKAYGLFFLVISIPIEIVQHTTKWLADPYELFQQYGLPASNTFGVDLYITDFVLVLMLLPWLAELCRRQENFYFPKLGYIFLLYFVWAMFGSLLEAPSFYLAIFEWFRELLYFVFFLYVVNNVVTAAQFRAVILALFVGLAIESVIVIAAFQFDIGTKISIILQKVSGEDTKVGTAGTVPVAESGSWSSVKRSTGTFMHPAMTAYYLGYIVPIVLAYFVAARRRWERVLFGALFSAGCLALVLTSSRAGVLGVIGRIAIFFPLARRSGLRLRRT